MSSQRDRCRRGTVSVGSSIFLLACLLCIAVSAQAATVVGYPESKVWSFIEAGAKENVSERCGSSLDRVSGFFMLSESPSTTRTFCLTGLPYAT